MLQSNIEQTTATVGTGAFALVAPSDPLRVSFGTGVGSGNPAYYRAEVPGAAVWEEGWGVVTVAGGETLTRNPIRSSNGNALVNFPAGTKRIYGALLADALRFGGSLELPTAGGTANARTVAHRPPCRVLRPGMVFRFVNGAAPNTGAATVQVDATAALPVQSGGAALLGGEMPAGALVTLVVNETATAFRLDGAERDTGWELVSPPAVVAAPTASVDFTLPAWAQEAELVCSGVTTDAAVGRDINLRLAVDGVPTYRAGATDYGQSFMVPSSVSAVVYGSGQGGHIPLWAGVGLAGASFRATLFGLQQAARRKQVSCAGFGERAGVATAQQQLGGQTEFTGNATHLRVLPSGGTINTGRFVLLGRR